MLAAINTDSLDYFTIDEWLNSNKHNDSYDAIRSNRLLNNDIFDSYYRTCATSK